MSFLRKSVEGYGILLELAVIPSTAVNATHCCHCIDEQPHLQNLRNLRPPQPNLTAKTLLKCIHNVGCVGCVETGGRELAGARLNGGDVVLFSRLTSGA